MFRRVGLPLALMLVGLGGYLSAIEVLPPINWVWPGLVGMGGVILLVIDRLSPFNFTVGLTLLSVMVVLVLRQAEMVPAAATVPLSLVAGGFFWTLSVLIFRDKKPD